MSSYSGVTDTCLAHYGNKLMAVPATPMLSACLVVVSFFARATIQWVELQKPGPGVTEPLFGLVASKIIGKAFGFFMALNIAPAVLYFTFANLNSSYRSQEFACFLQGGSNLGPGEIVTIIMVFYLILMVYAGTTMRNKTRLLMANRFSEAGYLAPAKLVNEEAPPSSRQPRILFLNANSGCWVVPFLKKFHEKVGTDREIDLVCIDNYGHPKFSDQRDDQWLRCNLKLEIEKFKMNADLIKLKVFTTDYWTLDLPSNSVDVVVLPTGASLNILRLDCKNPEEQEARLANMLAEVNRVLRPGGQLLSSSMTFLCALWDKAVARSGLEVPVQPEEETPAYVSYLPPLLKKIRSAMTPDPGNAEAHGTGRRGWLPKTVNWTLIPARLHLAIGTNETQRLHIAAPTSSDTANIEQQQATNQERISDVIPRPSVITEDGPLPTNDPIIYQNSLSDREERDYFPPGQAFRVADLLTCFNLATYIGFVITAWFYIEEMQVPKILPYGKQVSAFLMSLIQLLPTLLVFNTIELREAAKTKGLLIPPVVLRNKVFRLWSNHRLYFILLALFVLITWAPYVMLDYCLIKYANKTPAETQEYNVYISLAIGLFFMLGGKRFMKWLLTKLQKEKEEEDKAEAEDLQRETLISIESARASKTVDPEIPMDKVEQDRGHPKLPKTKSPLHNMFEKTKEFAVEPRI